MDVELKEALKKYDERFKRAMELAQGAFWDTIAENYPEMTSGDFSPDEAIEFDVACKKAITHWIDMN